MNDPVPETASLASLARRFLQRLLAVGENRLELLFVEMQEERERLLKILFFAIAAAALGLLAGIALTFAIVILLFLWQNSALAVAALFVLGGIYACGALVLCWRVATLGRGQQAWSGSVEQFKKDRAALEQALS